MTDNEIIELLERMITDYPNGILAEILILINCQKAEIERLKECPKCIYEYRGEMVEYCIQGPCSKFKTVNEIKSEAYKEFAYRLKQKSEYYENGQGWEGKICYDNDINKLVKKYEKGGEQE